MASAEAADSSAPPPAVKPAKGRSGFGLIAAAVVLSTAASGGVSFYISRHAAASQDEEDKGEHEGESKDSEPVNVPAPALYLPLDPSFVVNVEDPGMPRFLQAEIQVMSRDAAGLETVKAQLPRIRNSILMLLGQQKPADLGTRAGKEKLQSAVLAEVRQVMQIETGKPVIDAVYFTSFVMQ
ncbi:MAG: flagellar basal body-associated FliL family protein [Panacagrimonas sp.]